MSEPSRRLRPRALAAPLTLLTAAAAVVPIAIGAHLVIHGDSAPPLAWAAASGTGAAGPALEVRAASAARQPKPDAVRFHVRFHVKRHSLAPKSSRPAHQGRRRHGTHIQNPLNNAHALRGADFMFLDRAVLDMEAAGASPALLNFVNRRQNLVSTPLDKPKPLMNATRIQVFNSFTGIVMALASGHIAADTTAVVYDNERSTGTPAAELADPVGYCQMTAQLLHQHGLEYIASPGFDLSGPRPANGEWFRQFVRAGLMNCGRYADYLDIQDQLMQGTPTYARDARTAATLLRHINPRAKLLMGLSTSPSGHLATADQLWQAYQDTSQYVNGYWLNVPHNVAGTSRPSVALGFLHKMITKAR